MTVKEKLAKIKAIATYCLDGSAMLGQDELKAEFEKIRMIANDQPVSLDELREVLLKLRAARGPDAVEQRYRDYVTEDGDLAEHLREVPPYHYEDLYRAVKCDVIDAEVLATKADRDCASDREKELEADLRVLRSRLREFGEYLERCAEKVHFAFSPGAYFSDRDQDFYMQGIRFAYDVLEKRFGEILNEKKGN